MVSNICPLGVDFILGSRHKTSEQGNRLSQVALSGTKRSIILKKIKELDRLSYAADKLAQTNIPKEAFPSFWTVTAWPGIWMFR